jgi:hypothetical protein
MDVVSAETYPTEPAVANPVPDPRQVVTPLIPDVIEELLCSYSLFNDLETCAGRTPFWF